MRPIFAVINRRLVLCFIFFFFQHIPARPLPPRHASAGRACTFHSKLIFRRRPRRRLTLRCGARSPLRLTVPLLAQLSISFMACNLHPSSLPPAHLRSVCTHARTGALCYVFVSWHPLLTPTPRVIKREGSCPGGEAWRGASTPHHMMIFRDGEPPRVGVRLQERTEQRRGGGWKAGCGGGGGWRRGASSYIFMTT